MKCNVIEEVKKLTGGYGCDVYIEVSGSPASVNQGLVKMLLSFATTVVCCSYSDTISVLITVQCTQRHRYTQITHRLHTDTHRYTQMHTYTHKLSHIYCIHRRRHTNTKTHTNAHLN